MHFLTSIGIMLAISGLAAAGHVHYHHHQQPTHHGKSYVVVNKHQEPLVKHEWEDEHHKYELPDFEHIKSDHESDSHDDYEGAHCDVEEDYYAAPKYEFDYAVKDEKTGDAKKHWESRDGDKIKGSYTIKESDGTTRIVEYTADHKNGYNAVVKTVGHASNEYDHSHYGH